MTRPRHDRSTLERFLRREYRQVWARHRVTGEYVYLAEGEAEARREEARADWACPVPGCDGPISTRGKSKRDHFFHVNSAAHAEGESEWHLQSKAMLRQWAQAQGGDEVVVREEETAKDDESRMFRRADVMVTWPCRGDRRVAFEVEYKPFTAESWLVKHREYANAGIGCVWVLGHLPRYLKQPRKPLDWPENEPWDRFRWSPLARAIAAESLPVLFINPVERSIATVVVDGSYTFDEAGRRLNFWRIADDVGPRFHPRFEWDDDEGRLVVDSLDDCQLDETHGLVTPTMRWVMEQRAAIDAKAKADKESYLAQLAKSNADAAARREYDPADYRERRRSHDRVGWENSELRKRVVARCGTVPAFLEAEQPWDRGVLGHPAHWHTVLFQDLVLAPTKDGRFGRSFTVGQVYAMLSSRFKLHKEPRVRSSAISGFLKVLRQERFVEFTVDARGNITSDVTVVGNLDQRPKPPDPHPAPTPPPTLPQRVKFSDEIAARPAPRLPDSTPCAGCGGELYSAKHWFSCLNGRNTYASCSGRDQAAGPSGTTASRTGLGDQFRGGGP